MRRKFVLALSLMLLSLLTVQAQVVTLKVTNQPIREVLPMVEQQCDYHFFYNNNLTGLDNLITLTLNQTPLEQAL